MKQLGRQLAQTALGKKGYQEVASLVKKTRKPGVPRHPGPAGATVRRQEMSRGTAIGDYLLALTDPFNPRALGSRVPDQWSFPTASYHTQGVFTITSNASGVASVLLTPHPFYTAIDLTGSMSATGSMAPYAATPSVFAGVTVNNMAASLSEYRVVGAGIRIRNLIPPTTATGRMIQAHTPCTGPVPGPNKLASIAISNAQFCFLASGTLPVSTTAGLPSSILELPDSNEFTMQDLIASEYSFNYKPITPNAFRFRADDSIGITATQTMGTAAYLSATAVAAVGSIDTAEVQDLDGWDNLMLRWEGCPVSTAICEIEYVIHFEGSPVLSTALGSLITTSPPVSHVDLPKFHNVLSRALSIGSSALRLVGLANGSSLMSRVTTAAKIGLSL